MGKFSNFIKIFLYGEDSIKTEVKDLKTQTNSSHNQILSDNIYYKTGELMCKRNLVNSKIDGKVSWYSKDNTLQCEENYRDGIRNGKTIWYLNNKEFYSGEYINDYKEGLWIYNGSESQEQIPYKKGLINGIKKSLGDIDMEYKNGKLVYPPSDEGQDNDSFSENLYFRVTSKLEEKLNFIYGFDNWTLEDRMSDKEIREYEDKGLNGYVNLDQNDITINFTINNHPLVCHESMYNRNWNFYPFYKYEWFLVKNCENMSIEDLNLIWNYSFFEDRIEMVHERLGGRSISSIVNHYFPRN